jgi:uncharacterized protein
VADVDADGRDTGFLGIGWSFPPRVDATGDIALVAFEEDVRQAVRIILLTDPGERVMRPDFGSGLRALLFEPITEATKALVRHRVEEALIRWEPRIDSITVDVQAPAASSRIDIEIRYRIRSTNTFYNLVYPFYLLEGDRT